MSDQPDIIDRLRKTQENIAVVIGVIIALTLSIYFFTYAMLVDKGLSGLLWTQGLSAIAMVLMLIYLKPVSFLLARIWLGRRADNRRALESVSLSDIGRRQP